MHFYTKIARSLLSLNNKRYSQLLRNLYGSWDNAAKLKRKGVDIGMFHGTSSDNIRGVLHHGIRPNAGSYGIGSYVGELNKAKNYGDSIVKVKGPKEVTDLGLHYPKEALRYENGGPLISLHFKEKTLSDLQKLNEERLLKYLKKEAPGIDLANFQDLTSSLSFDGARGGLRVMTSSPEDGIFLTRIKGRAPTTARLYETGSKFSNRGVRRFYRYLVNKDFPNIPLKERIGLTKRLEVAGKSPSGEDMLSWQHSPKEMHFTEGLDPRLIKHYSGPGANFRPNFKSDMPYGPIPTDNISQTIYNNTRVAKRFAKEYAKGMLRTPAPYMVIGSQIARRFIKEPTKMDKALLLSVNYANKHKNKILAASGASAVGIGVGMHQYNKNKKVASFTKEQAHELAEKMHIKFDKFDEHQFHMGINVELEHGKKSPKTNITDNSPQLTANIALAHLNEIPDYYTRLKKMEDGAKTAGAKDAITALRRAAQKDNNISSSDWANRFAMGLKGGGENAVRDKVVGAVN